MKLQLVEKTNLIDDVWSFRFRSENRDMPALTAGQYVELEMEHSEPDDQGTKRYFTNSAAPYENVLQVTTRISNSSFKQALSALNTDDEAILSDGPYGEFTWNDKEPRRKVFIAGGIGITPFYSMLRERAHKKLPLAATLVYAGRDLDTLPFTEEFSQLEKEFPEFVVQYLLDQPLGSEVLQAKVENLRDSLIYISGPEDMVEAIGEDLKKDLELDDSQLVQDFFPGYDDATY